MSGVDIAGLVEKIRQRSLARRCIGKQTEKSRYDAGLDEEAADALLAQAAELSAKDGWVTHWQTKCQATRALEIEATRQRDEALAALKASEEARDAATKLADRYGVALMMIRAGCSNPQRFAGNILDDVKPIDIDLEDLT